LGSAATSFPPQKATPLRHFTGTLTGAQICDKCQQKLGEAISPNFGVELLQKLIALGILALDSLEPPPADKANSTDLQAQLAQGNCNDWICPDLTPYWKLKQRPNSDRVILQARQDNRQLKFSAAEGYALRHFTGTLTVAQICDKCQQKLGEAIAPTFIAE
jgi:uncharacterized protein (DUF983 family)